MTPTDDRAPRTSRVFVYGTLAPGRPNEHVLAGIPGVWEPASITGTLVHHGWDAALGSPGVAEGRVGDACVYVLRGAFDATEDLRQD